MKERNWKISIESSANQDSLTISQIDNVLNCYNDEEYQDFLSSMKEKDKEYDAYPVAKWQIDKSRNIEKTFFDKMTHAVNDNVVKVSVNFDISFPNDFDKDDVRSWVESLHRLVQIHPMTKQKQIIREKELFDENLAKREHLFLQELVNNEKIVIIRLK